MSTFLKSLNLIQKRRVWGWLSVRVFWIQLGHGQFPVCPAWLTAGPESHAASLAPQVCAVPETLLQSPGAPAWLFLWYEELWGWLGELMLAPIQSRPSSHLPCSHPTHRTPVGVPATEVGRKPRKKHSSSSFLFFSFSRQGYYPLSPLLRRGLKSH